MSIKSQNIFTISHSHINSFYVKNPKKSTPLHLKPLKNPLLFSTQKPHLSKIEFLQCKVKAFDSGETVNGQISAEYEYEFNIDALLSILEFLCLVSSAVVGICFAVNSWFLGSMKWLGNRVLGVQCVVLVGGVIIGSVIRRRQWRRICMSNFSRSGGGVLKGVNLLERIEQLEEDLRSSATIVRVLSRQLEKLGIRFRVTRKTLKDPISEAATLAQKNSEATRALALQGERLEKELGEIQKVLLAMQDQQQKQLELVLAIGKTGKLFENKRGRSQDPNQKPNDVSNTAVDGFPQSGLNQIQALKGQRETNK
ncbi:unnamed protein product [Withania somnifera]